MAYAKSRISQYFTTASLLTAFVCGAQSSAQADEQEIKFPGATVTSNPVNNDNNDIAGWYIDADGVQHGFYRVGKTGSLQSFDCPGSTKTSPKKITEEGKPPTPFVYGTYVDANGKKHGFKYDVSRKTCSDWQYKKRSTENTGANLKGASIDVYDRTNAMLALKGLYRKPSGKFVPIVVPDAQQYVIPRDINIKGLVVGEYDGNSGFMWEASTQTETNLACDGVPFTLPSAVNDKGVIIGSCGTSLGNPDGFVRSAAGTYTRFHVKGAAGTSPGGINVHGTIVGSFQDSANNVHGFLRTPAGTIETLDFPGATWTLPFSINSKGEIVGVFYDSGFNAHSFEMSSPP